MWTRCSVLRLAAPGSPWSSRAPSMLTMVLMTRTLLRVLMTLTVSWALVLARTLTVQWMLTLRRALTLPGTLTVPRALPKLLTLPRVRTLRTTPAPTGEQHPMSSTR